MMRTGLVALLALVLAAPAQALAQDPGGNPFGPLPQTPQAPPEPPEPQPVDPESTDGDGLGGTAFWLIFATTGLIFAAVAFVITRDMRRTTGARRRSKRFRGRARPAAAAADALAGDGRHQTGSQKARAKAQQRAKTKAARKQRRKTRSR